MEKQLIEDQLRSLNRMSFDERKSFGLQLEQLNPKLVFPWWTWRKCIVNVLCVTDGGLDFSTSGFGLAHFVSTFKKLEMVSPTNIQYRVTLAHLGDVSPTAIQEGNPDIFNSIKNFTFDNTAHFAPGKYDQVWLFGIAGKTDTNQAPSVVDPYHSAFYPTRNADHASYPTDRLGPNELTAIEDYMNGGGGMFATGDHGALGRSLCGYIQRIKDMRVWDNTSNDILTDEVTMQGPRRNDTNKPKTGAASHNFDDQSDDLPQSIYPKLSAGQAHYLLSISTSKVPSGIINIMPDHPHEGMCQPEQYFTVTHPTSGASHTIRTQNIAISFVLAGNTAGSKDPTDPHCFPSIQVWDGRPAKHGRIVVDSTWHHFVNINLNGFDASTFDIVQQYYMNIARWMTRPKRMLCLYRAIKFPLVFSERVVESSTDDPLIPIGQQSIADLYSIGKHAYAYLSEKVNQGFASEYFQAMLEEVAPSLAAEFDTWNPDRDGDLDSPARFLKGDGTLGYVAVGAGLLAIRQALNGVVELDEKAVDGTDEILLKGIRSGAKRAFANAADELRIFNVAQKSLGVLQYQVLGTFTAGKEPAGGLRVVAMDRDVASNDLLGEAYTDEKGNYLIEYSRDDFDKGGEKGGADIIVLVYSRKNQLLYKSKLKQDAPPSYRLDIDLS